MRLRAFLTLVVPLVFAAIFVRLGVWQLSRLREKRSFNAVLVARLAAAPAEIATLPADTALGHYRRVSASGTMLYDHEVVYAGRSREGSPGVNLLTPLKLAGRDTLVMVNRGWIPLTDNTPESWRKYDEPGQVTITGTIRTSLAKGEMGSSLVDPTLSPGETHLDYWNFANLPRLQEQLPYPILDVYVQQTPGSNPEALPYRLADQPDTDPGTHMGFALSWFVIGAVLLVGYPFWLKKHKNPPAKAGGSQG